MSRWLLEARLRLRQWIQAAVGLGAAAGGALLVVSALTEEEQPPLDAAAGAGSDGSTHLEGSAPALPFSVRTRPCSPCTCTCQRMTQQCLLHLVQAQVSLTGSAIQSAGSTLAMTLWRGEYDPSEACKLAALPSHAWRHRIPPPNLSHTPCTVLLMTLQRTWASAGPAG
jgi:hypothetical protein